MKRRNIKEIFRNKIIKEMREMNCEEDFIKFVENDEYIFIRFIELSKEILINKREYIEDVLYIIYEEL